MSEMDILFPIPTGGRNADDMGMPPLLLDQVKSTVPYQLGYAEGLAGGERKPGFGPAHQCPMCKGIGKITQDVMGMEEQISCHFCGGTGIHRNRLTIDERKGATMPDLTDADRATIIQLWENSRTYAPGSSVRVSEAIALHFLTAGREQMREECAQWCEKNKGTACAKHCAPAIRALK